MRLNDPKNIVCKPVPIPLTSMRNIIGELHTFPRDDYAEHNHEVPRVNQKWALSNRISHEIRIKMSQAISFDGVPISYEVQGSGLHRLFSCMAGLVTEATGKNRWSIFQRNIVW